MNRKISRYLTMVATLSLSLMLAMSASAQVAIDQVVNAKGALQESPNGIYIIQMIGDPAVAYEGGINGLKATKPRKGKKIDPDSKHVVDYVRHLNAKHAEALSNAGGGRKVYNYYYSFNGFAAELSHGQAKKLQSVDGVVAVRADEHLILDTATTPGFIGLEDSGGLWDQLGGIGRGGEDVIIGIVDGGVWPESLSFTDRTGTNGNASQDGKLDYQQIPGWHGKCIPGEDFNASHCNQKLIGARYYNAGFGGNAGIDATLPHEFNSPRDFGGHGTHTSSTAGGNHNTPLTGALSVLGTASGIAPRARIATYKVCWQTPAGGSCFSSDSTAAIDQAVADGVDVLNYSISGSRTNFLDSVEVAFLFAADAGIFVAASAGNSGPGASTVAHPGPWLTTVAATTHDRNSSAHLNLGNGATYTGASTNATGAGPADLVYSADVGLGGEDPTEVRLCYPGTLDPAAVAGNIVLCDRGVIARVDKSLAVFMAGGVGSILANPNAGQSQNADFHSVPTVHVDNVSGDAIRVYATGGGTPTAEILPSFDDPIPAPNIAGFSSRGPLLAGSGNLLKPDIAAPGQDIIAAVAPPGNGGADFAAYSGTSMSSPHVAGLGALLTDLHPGWSPMMIKSALMTTGTDLLSGADPFAQGAGFVNPTGSGDPGLVYNHGFIPDWFGFLCGTGQLVSGSCPFFEIDPSDLNVASVSIGALAGSQTVTRTATNVGSSPEYYEFSYAVPGIDIVANPATFTVAPGASQTYELTITSDGAPVDTYATGFVYWTGDQGHVVRSPVAVQPILFSAADEVSGSGTDSGTSFDVIFGYTGAYSAAAHGLEPATKTDANVADDPLNSINAALGTCDFSDFPNSLFDCTGITWHEVTVPAGTALTRFSLFDAYTDGNDDLDLYAWDSNFSQVGGSGSGTSAEQIDLVLPTDTLYHVAVHGWQTDGPDSNYTFFEWSVSATPGGNLSVDSAPASATLGATGTVDVSWAGAAAGTKHLGAVSHSDGVDTIGLTIVSVDTD